MPHACRYPGRPEEGVSGRGAESQEGVKPPGVSDGKSHLSSPTSDLNCAFSEVQQAQSTTVSGPIFSRAVLPSPLQKSTAYPGQKWLQG